MPAFFHFRNKVKDVAWTGLAAMLLIVIMPLLSQLAAAAKGPIARQEICLGTRQPGNANPLAPHAAMHQLSACGYCDLFVAPLPPVSFSTGESSWYLLRTVTLLLMPARIFSYQKFPSGRPRDPPTI